jgi:hypothetical protein
MKTRAAIFSELQREQINAAPPPVPDEVVLARERLRKAEVEYFARADELREAVCRAEGRKQ